MRGCDERAVAEESGSLVVGQALGKVGGAAGSEVVEQAGPVLVARPRGQEMLDEHSEPTSIAPRGLATPGRSS